MTIFLRDSRGKFHRNYWGEEQELIAKTINADLDAATHLNMSVRSKSKWCGNCRRGEHARHSKRRLSVDKAYHECECPICTKKGT
jgi:hypothetical protein